MEANELYDEDLPEGLLEIKRLIGIQATLALVDHYGGLHVKIPSRFDPDSRLARIVGHEEFAQMVQTYGGDTLYIGKAQQAIRTVRNIEIAQRYEGGKSAKELAREYGLTERWIWDILSRPETVRESPQQKLF